MVDFIGRSTTVYVLVVLTLVTSFWATFSDAEVLNDYILDYQPLTFNPDHLVTKHERVKRNVDPYLRWNFRAYGRTFNLHLEPAVSVFAPDHHMEVGGKREDLVDTSYIYEGIVSGEPSSQVHMSIHNGSVLGFISIPGQTVYHMEPSNKYFKNPTFPSIIYPESRMNLDPYRHKRAAASQDGSCFSQSLFAKLEEMSQPVDTRSAKRKKRNLSTHPGENPYTKYSAHFNEAAIDASSLHRYRRALTDNEKTCFMSLRADEILFEHIKTKTGNDDQKAREALLSMFALHIAAINAIYEPTTFKLKTSATPIFRGIRFQLQRSTIITECANGGYAAGYCTDNLDVSNFLDLTSLENHDAFCLVHTFTYRDFVGGTLGLAWVATPDSKTAGVCGQWGRVSDNGKIRTKSLNTGITTLINFNQEVASRVSQLTFAHEVGHNFGAQHDVDVECAPYGSDRSDARDGNYIMYPSANTGNLPHNDEFSVCSKDYIAKVLEAMGTPGGRVYCFKQSNAAFCGNGIVEGDEMCDCGYEDECLEKACCNPRPNEGTNDDMCKRPSSVECSPSQGPCCNQNCQFVGSGQCLTPSDCAEASSCIPDTATCPPPVNKADNETFCDTFNRVCISGECTGTVCRKIGWLECFKKESEVSQKEEMCYVACKKDDSSECVSSYDTDKLKQAEFAQFKTLLEEIQQGKSVGGSNLGVKLPTGSACNYGKGYCDVLSKCRNYDAEGPFRQLTKLIFDPVTLERVRDWVVDYWWAVLLMGIGVIVFMAVFVKIFGYNTPSEDPKKKRRAQAMPRTNPQADKRPANNQQQRGGGAKGGGRAGVYSTDLPMHHNPPHGAHQSQGHQGHHNQGYESYQDYTPYQPPQGVGGYGGNRGQQFDRISGPRRY